MTSEGRAQKFHTDDVLLLISGWCFWLVWPREKFASTNQEHYPDLGCDACSMEFLHSFLTLPFAGNQWWHLERSAVFSGLCYRPSTQSFCHVLNIIIKKKKPTINFKMFQTVQVLDTLERQWSFKTEESHTFYIGNFSSHLNFCIKHHASWHPKNSWDIQETTL